MDSKEWKYTFEPSTLQECHGQDFTGALSTKQKQACNAFLAALPYNADYERRRNKLLRCDACCGEGPVSVGDGVS